MRTGKRWLAGFATAALAAGALTVVAASPAQAVDLPVAYCAAAGGNAGVVGDPTSVSTDCTAVGGPARTVPIELSNLLAGDDTATIGGTGGARWVFLSVSGNGTFVYNPADPSVVDDSNAAINADDNAGWFAGPGKGLGVGGVAISEAITAQKPVFVRVGSVPSTLTITVATSSAANFADITTLNTTTRSPITVTVTGGANSMVVSPAYTTKAANVDDSAAIALVQVFDGGGNPIAIQAADVAIGQIGTNVSALTSVATDCVVNANGNVFGAGATNRDLNDGALIYETPACTALNTTGTGVWLRAGRLQTAGTYQVTVVATVGGNSYTENISYTVASPVAGAYTATLDNAAYTPGSAARATWCAKNLAGANVPDGLGWGGGLVRQVNLNANAITGGTNFQGAGVTNFNTYNGCFSVPFFAPTTPMVYNLITTTLDDTGWAVSAQGIRQVATATVGTPEPTTPTIVIVGDRESGSSVVVVEGTTTNLVGQAVTPYFRFPGQTGFTAGTGTRTVDAEGNFNWQRKTGKQISVQFRAGDARSNTVIIDAK